LTIGAISSARAIAASSAKRIARIAVCRIPCPLLFNAINAQ
jgi:hypothetical protein